METRPAEVLARSTVQLHLRIFHPDDELSVVKDFYSVHEKLLHLFVISRDLEDYQHIHPQLSADGSFVVETILPRTGEYEVVAEYFPVGGTPQLFRRRFATADWPHDARPVKAALKPDPKAKKSIDGTEFELKFDPPTPVAGVPVTLTYELIDTQSRAPVQDLEPFLGAWGHTVIMSEDAQDFVHSHPSTGLPAAENSTAQPISDPEISFETFFARAGRYRIWSQFLRAGKLTTASFDVNVLRSEPIAAWSTESWSAVSPNLHLSLDGTVRAVAGSLSSLYVGGDFRAAGELDLNGVAMWNGRQWSPLGSGVNGKVWALAVSGRDVYVGGDFTMAGGIRANGIAKWDGNMWSALGDGVTKCLDIQCAPAVYALAIRNGNLYAGGRFAKAGATDANGIARWDGTNWFALDSGVRMGSYDGVVRSIATDNTRVYVGGSFHSAGQVPARHVAMWNGREWLVLGEGVSGGLEQVLALAVRGKELIVGGDFSRAGAVDVSNMAVWNGTRWLTLGTHTNGPVQVIASNGADVYFGGGVFTPPIGKAMYGVAKWNSVWSGIASTTDGKSHIAPVTALAIVGRKIIAGGGPFALVPTEEPRKRTDLLRPVAGSR